MTFEEFLREKNVMDKETLDSIVMVAGQTGESFYKTLCESLPSIGGEEGDLIDMYCEFDPSFVRIDNGSGMKINMSLVKELGGISVVSSMSLIPLINQDGEIVIIYRYPDVSYSVGYLDSQLTGKIFKKCLCITDLFLVLWSLYMEPLEIASQAAALTSKDTDENYEYRNKDSAVRSLYMRIVAKGYQMRASDIKFKPERDTCEIMYRIDGHYQKWTEIPKDMLQRICNILCQDGAVSETKPHQPIDGKTSVMMPNNGRRVDLRFSIIPSTTGSDVNIRFLSNGFMTFEQLGMTQRNVSKYKRILTLPQGLIVMVGPTGSGKTTTLYSGLNFIKHTMANIITIEDPVEISMEGITQIDVDSSNSKLDHLTFPEALKACLRHDPDVIVVGEMRDDKTADEALRAATTGHLVLASLHTNDSISVFERLYNMGIEPYSLGEVLVAIMGQRLVRRLCPHCKQAYELTVTAKERAAWGLPVGKTFTLYKPTGCTYCGNIGYYGRIAINEILEIDAELRDLIQRHARRSEIEEYLSQPRSDGSPRFVSMYTDGMNKVLEGVTSLDEMGEYARDRTAFKGGIAAKKIPKTATVSSEKDNAS